jgi:hypothetical protein
MVVAIIYPDPAKLRRKGSGLPDLGKTEQNRLSYARTVLRDRDDQKRRVLVLNRSARRRRSPG